MLPTQPPTTNAAAPAPAPKRKNADDANFLGNASKRPRNDPENIPGQNFANRVEKKGNFIITRKPSVPQSSQDTSREPQRPLSRATHSGTEGTSSATSTGPSTSKPRSKPPSVASTTDPAFARVRKKGKGRDVPAGTTGDHEVEEDVRQMNSEADNLRDRSRASIANMTPAAMTVELEFPPPKSSAPNGGKSRVQQLKGQFEPGGPSQTDREGTIPIAEQETPQIVRNRLFRGESRPPSESSSGQSRTTGSSGPPSSSGPGSSRRRSSFSMRGKRVSSTFESTGIITMPHTSVSDNSLYKHIDPELPESQRIRQLLIWVASRAKEALSSRGGKRKANDAPPPDANLPPLPPGGAELLKEIEDDIIQQLAEKKIDTSAYSGPSGVNGSWKLKENEQNVKNRAREKLFTEQIEDIYRRKKEDLAWAEVAQFYNAHQTNVLSAINQKNRAAKGKGKQRAASQEPEDLEPWENELPEKFRGPKGCDAAKQLIELGVEGVGKGDPRLEQLQFKEDRLYAALSVARQLTHIARLDLDRRFALLNLSLAQRTLPPSSEAPLSGQQALSNFVPATALPLTRHTGPDAQDLLRALTRTDAARPRAQVGDAARRAAKDVQRARESQVHQSAEGGVLVQERKLTDVPPPTPRKPPGTPKRAGTPGASRR
ncbi:hypothetical protein ACEPAF_8014 [Sanghuangporus sanghuang]